MYNLTPHFTLPHLTSLHLTSLHLTSPHLTLPHFTLHHLTSPHITSQSLHLTLHSITLRYVALCCVTSPRLAPPRLTSPHLTLLFVRYYLIFGLFRHSSNFSSRSMHQHVVTGELPLLNLSDKLFRSITTDMSNHKGYNFIPPTNGTKYCERA